MKIDLATMEPLSRPAYVLEESLLMKNLDLIASVAQRADVEIILAFKAFALWKTFPLFRKYIHATTASSLNEARLGYEEFGSPTHTYSPAYTAYEIEDIARFSSHLTFNSLTQYNRLSSVARRANPKLSVGLRVNPQYSEIQTLLYNPCAPGSRFGIVAADLPCVLPDGVEGFHCHCHCESSAEAFRRTLGHIEREFSRWFPQIKWINLGGGHLMTREGYNIDLLVQTLNEFHRRYPHLKIVLEPGSAFAWHTGSLVSQVADIVENDGIRTAVLNVSFTCHMPDCLEMPYYPKVRFARCLEADSNGRNPRERTPHVYRLGGNSCLSGDYMGYWEFDHDLRVGENVIFEDMLHYTTVKTNMFNGVSHPSILLATANGELTRLRTYTYEDYKSRMD